jgi:peptidoglycan/LPS O-acetylase OafA/YrhL
MTDATTAAERVPSSLANRRFYELDLLRFIAAVEVMMFHYTIQGYSIGLSTVDFTAMGLALEYFYFGVEMLFVLSGFVILKSVQQKSALGFLSARFVRLGPTYWICVTLTAVVLLAANTNQPPIDLASYFANLTMAASAFGYEHIDGVYWTMEVQLVFYAWVFLVCLMRQIHNADKFLGLWLLATILINVFGGLTFTKLDYLLLPKLSCYFIAGAVFFLIYQRGRSLYLWSMVAACYAMAIGLALSGSLSENPAADVVGNTLLFALFARIVTHGKGIQGRPWMVTLFKMTYPLYLIHQRVGYVLLSKFDGLIPKYVLLVAVIAIMLLTSLGIATQVDAWVMPPVKKAVNRVLQMAERPHTKPLSKPKPSMAAAIEYAIPTEAENQYAELTIDR